MSENTVLYVSLSPPVSSSSSSSMALNSIVGPWLLFRRYYPCFRRKPNMFMKALYI
jgi:hypothetical protein